MTHYIDKSALVAEIERRISDNKKDIERASHKNLEDYFEGYEDALVLLKEKFIDTLEVKEVDLEKEYEEFVMDDPIFGNFITNDTMGMELAKHFFELGLRVNSPITEADRCRAEGIIIHLKQVEQDYQIDLTEEMEWLRNQVKKRE